MTFKKGFFDRVVDRALSPDDFSMEEGREAGAPFWQNIHAWLAVFCGIVLLLITYGYTEEKSFIHAASHEIGFALIVAVLIWVIFEVASRQESNKTWNDRIDRISKNVFFGVLGRNLSSEIISEARFVALDHSFERRNLHVTYNLSDASYKDRIGNDKAFIALRATTRFKIKNISNKTDVFPVSVGLPNPLINEMKPFCKVHKVSVRNDENIEVIKLED